MGLHSTCSGLSAVVDSSASGWVVILADGSQLSVPLGLQHGGRPHRVAMVDGLLAGRDGGGWVDWGRRPRRILGEYRARPGAAPELAYDRGFAVEFCHQCIRSSGVAAQGMKTGHLAKLVARTDRFGLVSNEILCVNDKL